MRGKGSHTRITPWLLLLVSAAVLSVGGFIYHARHAVIHPSGSGSAVRADPSDPVTCLGRLEPRDEVIHLAISSGDQGVPRIQELLVREGDEVHSGQVLAVLDNRERLQAAVHQAESRVKVAQGRLARVKAGAKVGDIDAQKHEIERSQAELQHAQTELQRLQGVHEKGIVSDSSLDRQKLEVETKTQQLQWAKEVLNSLLEVRPVDIQLAETEVDEAIANLGKAKADLSLGEVRSSIDGQILKIHARPGEKVGEKGFAELGSTQQMYAVAEVYETDIGRVRAGQRATMTSDALPGPIHGQVERIGLRIGRNDVLNTDPAADTDVRVVEVKIRLDGDVQVRGLTNLQVEVEIIP